MEENQVSDKKTTITVPRTLLVRLQGLMKYGDTYNDKINELIDLYVKIARIDPKAISGIINSEGDKHE